MYLMILSPQSVSALLLLILSVSPLNKDIIRSLQILENGRACCHDRGNHDPHDVVRNMNCQLRRTWVQNALLHVRIHVTSWKLGNWVQTSGKLSSFYCRNISQNKFRQVNSFYDTFTITAKSFPFPVLNEKLFVTFIYLTLPIQMYGQYWHLHYGMSNILSAAPSLVVIKGNIYFCNLPQLIEQ